MICGSRIHHQFTTWIYFILIYFTVKKVCLINLHKFIDDNTFMCALITKQFKEDCLYYDLDTEHELIVMCLKNNHDINMITQLNLVTYAGPLYNKDNLW
jgi:hypothetical protein